MGREPVLYRIAPLTPWPCDLVVLCGISSRFQLLSPSYGQVAHALLTRPPLTSDPKIFRPFDLHGLGTPPAFVLSQDQTLSLNLSSNTSRYRFFITQTNRLDFFQSISRSGVLIGSM